MKAKWATIVIAGLVALWMVSCSSPASDTGNHPADHTVNKNGTYHKPGLDNPLANCISCHGADLKGGTVGVSCFQCHGQKW